MSDVFAKDFHCENASELVDDFVDLTEGAFVEDFILIEGDADLFEK